MKESILPRMHTATQDAVLGGIIKHLNDKKMVIVLGEPGEGKTITILDFCVQNSKPSYYFRCSPNTTMNSLLIFIAKAVGVRVTDNNDQMQALIQERLKNNPNYCFVFDEVEYLANGNCKKLDVLRQIYDDTDVSIVICGTYELKDLISGERKSNQKKNHNRSQLFRRLRLAEFGLIDEKEIYEYLQVLEKEFAVRFDSKVKSALITQCRDRSSGGLGNFIELIELIFSQVRPEWQAISNNIIHATGRVLHTHTEYAQSFTGIKPRKKNESADKLDNDAEIVPVSTVPSSEPLMYIDVASLPVVHIDIATYNDSLRHKMLK